jgi:hypothetical protein
VAPTAHRAAQSAQDPKDGAEDDQDATDYPKDGAVDDQRQDDQDDADGDHGVFPSLGYSAGIDSIGRPQTSGLCYRLGAG